jgi:hypothetical protein
MRKWMLAALALVSLVSCGKSQDYYNAGYAGYNPGGYVPSAPQGYYPPISSQVPTGYPQQYQPFAPVYNYFQQSTAAQQYYAQLWYQWQIYAQAQRVSVYNFPVFWYNFCPQQMPRTFYSWFDVNVYQPGGSSYCGQCY